MFQILVNSCLNLLSVFYNILQSAYVLNTVVVSFLTKFITGGVELERMRPGCSRNMLSAMVFWGVFNF